MLKVADAHNLGAQELQRRIAAAAADAARGFAFVYQA